MIDLSRLELWVVPGAQSLYGETALAEVAITRMRLCMPFQLPQSCQSK